MDYSIRIGGEAGQGIQTIGDTLARVFARTGYHVFTHQDYESRVRGGHNFYQVRLSDAPVMAPRDRLDIIVALDNESIERYGDAVTDAGFFAYDSKSLKRTVDNLRCIDIPFADLAKEHGGSTIMSNTVAVGAVLGMLGMQLDALTEILQAAFEKKGQDVVDGNIRAAAAGYNFSGSHCEACSFSPAPQAGAKMLIAGNDAIGLGAVASGVKFYTAYPMTPSTGIMNYIASKGEEYGIIVEQAEDEIAAVNMALGASFAGVRSMTGTSGGGFALMVEGLSLAGITETPVVIALAQRPGPATGLPTRTEQGDLLFALYTAHGEFPRVIFAPGTPEQAFYLTSRAFGIAEKFQIPVIILSDQYLGDTQWTFEAFDMHRIHYADQRLRGEQLKGVGDYKRHAFTGTGVTPLAVPGDSKHLVVTDSDEHDESGHLIEDAETRVKMVNKRLFQKLPHIREEISPPALYGTDKPDMILVGWGSTYGLLREAVDQLGSQGRSAAMLHFSEIYPFPEVEKFDYLSLLNSAETTLCIENNATGQFARLMRTETGFQFRRIITRYDGRPFSLEDILGEIDAH
jgi:2-oxoglutarate ferredoxin oxidoreductase subunit alpha